MANIPGISGYVQPGVFARDRVISRGVSIPGGLRIPCIMGEGLREETIVEAAAGNGQDGDANCSPTGDPAGRFFSLRLSPIVTGRTELYLNGSPLRGVEAAIDESSFDGAFDFRIDPETGCIELQGASIGDQNGKRWSASTLNSGNGIIPDETCGTFETISILDKNAPPERWTIKAVSVTRDSNGDPIPGLTTFTVTGSVSGQIKNSAGQPIVFHDSYYKGSSGATSGSESPCDDGYVVAEGSSAPGASFPEGVVISDGGETPTTSTKFQFTGNIITPGQAVVGDYLCLADGYSTSAKISKLEYSSSTNTSTITVENDSLPVTSPASVAWTIRATNLFVDDSVSGGVFTSSVIGRVLMICGGDAAGLYRIDKVTSNRRLRVSKLESPTLGFPSLPEESVGTGLSSSGQTFYILETNGILLFGIEKGTIPFLVGDKFFIDVKSKALKKNDRLEAKYIAESDINDPQLFVSAQELAQKHGQESLSNTLSLGARLCFENQAPYVLALQCKPAVPRRTSVTIVPEKDSSGKGGLQVCNGVAADCEADDLTFIIPLPTSGLQKGKPDVDTQVNIFVTRGGVETQIFPNKVPFYDSTLSSPTGQYQFITDPEFEFSYTIIETGFTVLGQGYEAVIKANQFSTQEINFDGADVGKRIVIQSLKDSSGTIINKVATAPGSPGIAETLFGVDNGFNELVISEVLDDGRVVVECPCATPVSASLDVSEVQFYIKDPSDTSSLRAAIMFHKDLVSSGALKKGDGLRISYIDQVDAKFFDSNWFEAFESLEAQECQIVVPLPLQNRSSIFRAAVQHVETMSTIAIQKERIAMFGAQQGVTVAALLGQEEVAVEDVGVLEGIQGDDLEEIANQNIEDMQNFKLNDNYTSNRAVYFYPDQVVRPINGTNTFIDGFYMAAAAAGYLASTQNVAIPLTNKVLAGFNILRDKKYRPVVLNQLGSVGATVVQPVVGGGKVLAGRTTSQSGFVEDEEISIVFIRDRVKEVLRQGLQPFIGVVEDNNTLGSITSKVVGLLASLVTQGLITGYKNVRVERDKIDPRQWNVYLQFQPAYPINYIFIDIEVGVL